MGGAAWPPHGRGRDGVSYRIAEAHLQVLAEYEPIQTAIRDLKRTGTDLGTAWRLSRKDDANVEEAWRAQAVPRGVVGFEVEFLGAYLPFSIAASSLSRSG